MKTVNVSDPNHQQLLKIQGELQQKTGKRVELDQVISKLLEKYKHE